MEPEQENGNEPLTRDQFDEFINQAFTYRPPRPQPLVLAPQQRGLIDFIRNHGARNDNNRQFNWFADELQQYPQTATEAMITHEDNPFRWGRPDRNGINITQYVSEEELQRRLAGLGIEMPQSPGGRQVVLDNIRKYGHPCGNTQKPPTNA